MRSMWLQIPRGRSNSDVDLQSPAARVQFSRCYDASAHRRRRACHDSSHVGNSLAGIGRPMK